MSLPFLFAHGWAYDANIFGGVRDRMGGPESLLWERGYYGADGQPAPTGPYIAVGHSFGVMRLLADLPPGAVGFVSICGFARFSSTDGYSGTPVRVIDRMLARFKSSPLAVVAEFRARCGSPATKVYEFEAERLKADLETLRDGDERAAAAALGVPVLSLVAGADPIVSASMGEAAFPTAERAVMPGVGHLVPLRSPDWCAQQISAFAAKITR